MDRVTTYNPRKIMMSVGNHIVSGFSEDSFITVESLSDGITSKTGADGEMVRNIDPKTQKSIKLVLQYGSLTNKFLLEKNDRDIKEGNGTFPLLIKDILGGTTISADVAWVVKAPPYGYGKEAGDKEWEIHTGNAVIEQE